MVLEHRQVKTSDVNIATKKVHEERPESGSLMIGPLQLEGPLDGALHKRYPLELHWRQNPDSHRGNIEKAYYKVYPQLKDEVVCFQCGAIPCPNPHNDAEKKQRLVDLEFVKDLAKERRDMKAEMDKMIKELSETRQFQVRLKFEKEMMREKLSQLENEKSDWINKKQLLEAEVKRLMQFSDQQAESLNELKKDKLELQHLRTELEQKKLEIQKLVDENKQFRGLISKQSDETTILLNRNAELQKDLEVEKGKCQGLRVHLNEAQTDISRYKEQIQELNSEIDKTKEELTSLLTELRDKTREWERKEQKLQALAQELRLEMHKWKARVSQLETDKGVLESIIKELQKEIAVLKKKLSSDTRFRQFIEVKRDFNRVRDVNERLATKVMDYEHRSSCPVVKASGKTQMFGSTVQSVRPLTAILDVRNDSPVRRGKSAESPQNRRGKQVQTPASMRPSTASSFLDLDGLTDFDDESRVGSMMDVDEYVMSELESPELE